MEEAARHEQSKPHLLTIIVNSGSGSVGNADLGSRIGELFRGRGLDPKIYFCERGEEIASYARKAQENGPAIVVAGGGDGTVSAVASVVAGTDATLGVLPLGTLNHFAKDLGVPIELEGAITTIADGHAVMVDIGEVNGRTFINNSSLGLYPRIVQHREAQQRLGRSKWWAFFKALLTVLGRYPFLRVRLSTGETEMVRRTPFVFIGNNEYEIHGLNIGSRARIDSGQLSVYLTHGIGRLGLLRLALRGLFGRLRDAGDFDRLGTSELQVDVRGRMVRVALDGEVFLMEPPLRYRCHSRQLRVIVPEPTT